MQFEFVCLVVWYVGRLNIGKSLDWFIGCSDCRLTASQVNRLVGRRGVGGGGGTFN